MTTCPHYVPDLQAQGDCINCGWSWEYHSKEARKAMPTKDDLIKRLRSFANGCRGSMWQSRDETICLMDEAADTIRALQAENERLRAALRTIRDLKETGFPKARAIDKADEIARAALGDTQ